MSVAAELPRRATLLRVLGLAFGIAVTVGNTIGSGILRTPGDVATQLPGVWPFLGVWVAGALYALLGANIMAELGTMLPQSGGHYVFSRRALGAYPGFVVGWSDWLATCGSMTAVAMVIGEYSSAMIPRLDQQQTALGVILGFALIQWGGVRWGNYAQQFTTLLKTVAFMALIGACFLLGRRDPADVFTETSGSPATMLAWVIALQAVIFTYDGWAGPVYFSEEVRESRRNIPRSMFGSLGLIAAIYLLLNLGFLMAVPISRIAGQPLAAATVAGELFGPRSDFFLRVLLIVSLLSGINAFHLMASRVIFAMSRDGLVSRRVEQVGKGGTPQVALLLGTVVAALFLLTETYQRALALLSFFFVAIYTLSFTSFFVLRIIEPNMQRPYRAWGHPLTTGLAFLGSIGFLAAAVWSDTRNSIYALIGLALSYPVYLLTRKKPDAGNRS